MKALAGQFFTFTNMLKLPMIINTGLDYVDTDMNLMTMIRAANCFRIFGENSIKSEMLDGDFKTIDDISYWVTTPSQVSHTLDKLGIPHTRITEI